MSAASAAAGGAQASSSNDPSAGFRRFISAVERVGFSLERSPDARNTMFVLFEFVKASPAAAAAAAAAGPGGVKRKTAPVDEDGSMGGGKKQKGKAGAAWGGKSEDVAPDGSGILKPCIYKKR